MANSARDEEDDWLTLLAEGEELSAAQDDEAAQALQQTAAAQLAQALMGIDLGDPASRAQARKVVESLEDQAELSSHSALLDRRIQALAQADAGSSKVVSDLQRLAARARSLGAPNGSARAIPQRAGGSRMPDFLDRLRKRLERGSKDTYVTLQQLDGAVSELVTSAEVLRQNNVALNGYEADIGAENQRVFQNITRANSLHAALIDATTQARNSGAADIVRFVEREMLYPLERHRQNLQTLLAVNQQAGFSLAILRQTNTELIEQIRLVTVATRNALETAMALRRTLAAAARSTVERDIEQARAEEQNIVDALDASLHELRRAIESHEAWRGQAVSKKQAALSELRERASHMIDADDAGVPS